MARPPRTKKPHVHSPSPLQQVHLTRPLSTAPPPTGLVRDPNFWKRFSTAVHMTEIDLDDMEKGTRTGRTNSKSSSGSLDKEGNEWLAQQAREKRQCRTICISITLVVMLIVAAAAIVGWYFTNIKKI